MNQFENSLDIIMGTVMLNKCSTQKLKLPFL